VRAETQLPQAPRPIPALPAIFVPSYVVAVEFTVVLAAFLITGLITFVLNRLASLPWRRSAGAHWTERARVLWPVRTTAFAQIFLLPVLVLCAIVIWRPVEVPALPVVLFAAWCGAILGTWPLDHAMFPGLRFGAWLHEVALTWLLRFGIWFAWLAAVWLMPLEWDWEMAFLFFSVVLLQLIWTRFAIIVLRLVGAFCPPDERLSRIVGDASARAGVPVRHVWVANGCSVNAFALPLSGQLIFSRRLLEELDDAELQAVCAHELGHLGESRPVKTARLIASFAITPLLLVRPVTAMAGAPGCLALVVVALLLKRLAMQTARKMEHRADDLASVSEMSPGAYARALQKIYEGNQMPAVMPGTGALHPHLYDRMLNAGVTPDFPRPLAPAQRKWYVWVLLGLLSVMIIAAMRVHDARKIGISIPATLFR
jgi:Zn-dependent protease with chaperone function